MKRIVFISLLCLVFGTVHSQDFQNTLKNFNGRYVPERIHLHLDKTSYSPGDTIWFKAYILNGIQPTEKSKTLYVDWTDEKGEMITRTTSPIAEGTTFGQIAVPDNYNFSFIHLKAYTKWMLNFDSSLLYEKDLRILNAGSVQLRNLPVKYSMVLFPEGGNLVTGLNNKVAFKVADQYGRPGGFEGAIFTNGVAGEKISPVHDGMGDFFILPQPGKKYEIRWTDSTGGKHTTAFPEIMDKGVNLRVEQVGENKVFSVGSNDPEIKAVHILGSMYNQIVFSIDRQLTESGTQALVPVSSLPTGILTITVLDQLFHPLAERVTFINNDEYHFPTEMNVEHWGLNKRSKDEIEISIPDNISANLSVSVTDNAIDYDSTSNIFSDFLLNSELKGRIYNPAYYFSGDKDSVKAALDLVMLTNGWRKIMWQDLAEGKLPKIQYQPDTVYQTITGKVFGATATQLRNAGDIVLVVNQGKENEFLTAPIKSDGTFEVPDFTLFDTATVYYQPPKNRLLQSISVQFMNDRLPVQSITRAGLDSFTPSTDTAGSSRHQALSKELLEQMEFFGGKVLENVTITARTKSAEQELDQKYTSGFFSGGVGTSFDLRDDKSASAYQDIFQYLQGRVAGVQITSTNPPSITWRGGTPALFLDEMQVDASTISTVPVTNIAYVKVLNPPFMGAVGGGANGAIAIYTRKGSDITLEPGEGLSKNILTGYSVIRQFYSPDYEKAGDEKRDLRTTLYWNPQVSLRPGSNKAVLKFFNNDVAESFRVVIEGITPDGRLSRLVQIME